jgi:signal transduction histidine kinase
MKTRTDKTIPTIIILYGLFLIILLFIISDFKLTTFSIWWIGFWTLIVLFGLWKIEAFEIRENKLTKTNFLGLFNRSINLDTLLHYDKKVIDTNHFENPFNVVKWFSKDNRYLVFRQITILTEGSGKMVLDERTINKEDFNKLYAKIKGYKNKKKN